MYLCPCICSKTIACSVSPYITKDEPENKTAEIAQDIFVDAIILKSPIKVRVTTEDGRHQIGFIDSFSENKRWNVKTLESTAPSTLSRITNYLK